MIELGQKAEDKVTGFYGTITARAQYLTGCDQYCLAPPIRQGINEVQKSEWFDEGRIKILGPGISAADVAGPARGGPQRDMPTRG
ncbi:MULTISPECIES: hypothetical protein [Pseudomonas]|uniref:Uncharacterized protein n=1 Tax=Pseudomonas fluorescens TaxID=294 RepID=A0A5E7FLY5_PSEFL|nr:hypothetical protein [Pseudomonas fluorescens]VVO40270.1 hypothetical protein PS712_05787 [Pseudomonas fluorescens]